MKLRAYAKINLGLDVLGERPDGYHEVRMIMQTIRLFDELEMEKSPVPGVRLRSNRDFVPLGENNLVCRAAKLLMDRYEIREGVDIYLRKVIPVAAGLAGGSSDAAAALVGINRLLRLGLSQRELMRAGLSIGADVPFCILRGTAMAEGIGEMLTPLHPMPDCRILIGKPKISVSTRHVYAHLTLDEHTKHPDIDGIRRALWEQDVRGLAGRLGNVLEDVTVREYPVIDEIREHMLKHGALGARMSGSGPTVFGIFDDGEAARRAYESLRNSGLSRMTYLTEPFHARNVW